MLVVLVLREIWGLLVARHGGGPNGQRLKKKKKGRRKLRPGGSLLI